MVGVCVELTLGDLDVVFGDDLVEGVGSAAEDLAGIAVAASLLVRCVESGRLNVLTRGCELSPRA